MEHYEQLFVAVQFTVYGDEMAAFHAIVKTIGTKRHFSNDHAKSLAEFVEVGFGERADIPRKAKTSYFIGEELHKTGAANLYDR
jgi:hypothetical protein